MAESISGICARLKPFLQKIAVSSFPNERKGRRAESLVLRLCGFPQTRAFPPVIANGRGRLCAMGYNMPPATRADFFNELPRDHTSSQLKPTVAIKIVPIVDYRLPFWYWCHLPDFVPPEYGHSREGGNPCCKPSGRRLPTYWIPAFAVMTGLREWFHSK